MAFWNRRQTQNRSAFTRTTGDILVNDLGPSGTPFISWIGYESGGLAEPIGPHGPWAHGRGEFLPVVTRATSLIIGPLTAAPFEVRDVDPGKPVASPRWITDPMLLRPDERFSPSVLPAVVKLGRAGFWADWIRSAVWWGVGAFIAAEDGQGQPVAGTMRLLNPLLLDTERNRDGVLCWALGSEHADGGRVVFDRDGRLFLGSTSYRLFTLRNPHSPIDSEGRSKGVFELAPQTFRLGRQIESYTSGTFRSGIPAGYLKANQPHLSSEAAQQLKEGWLANHGGDRRSIAVLNATTEFVPLNLSPVDAALGEVKTLQRADVAEAFGLDPMTLGAGGGSGTYTNLRDAWSNHKDFGLAPWLAAVEDTLSALLPSTQSVKVDLDRFANPEPGARYAAYKTGIDAGIITVDEARATEGLPPLPDSASPSNAQLVQIKSKQEEAS